MPYIKNPLEIIATWHGGMSFHGGLIGGVLAAWIFSRRRKIPFAAVADIAIVTCPIGLGLGRLGNFINGELLGRPTRSPLGDDLPRRRPDPAHPTQLYESLGRRPAAFRHNVAFAQKTFQRRHDGRAFSSSFTVSSGL